MLEPVDELYLVWLYSTFASPRDRVKRRCYWNLARTLFTTEFVWLVPNDDNRVEDGKNLRGEFAIYQTNIPDEWFSMECSVLEMLIGLSRRLEFETDLPSSDWFWKLLENIGLSDINDSIEYPEDSVRQILDDVIYRRYLPDGSGGLFPLQFAEKDQRKLELWYQMCAYIIERDL